MRKKDKSVNSSKQKKRNRDEEDEQEDNQNEAGAEFNLDEVKSQTQNPINALKKEYSLLQIVRATPGKPLCSN